MRAGARAGLPTERAGGAPSRALTLSFALRRPLPQTWINSGECCGRAGGEGEGGPGGAAGSGGRGVGAGDRPGCGDGRGAAHGAQGGCGRGVITDRSPRSSRAPPPGPQDPGAASPPLSRQLSRPRWRSFSPMATGGDGARAAAQGPASWSHFGGTPRPRPGEPPRPSYAPQLRAGARVPRGPAHSRPGTSPFEYSQLLAMSPLSSDNPPFPPPRIFLPSQGPGYVVIRPSPLVLGSGPLPLA